MTTNIQQQKNKILKMMLKLIPSYGFSLDTLNLACRNSDLPENSGLLLFPSGLSEIALLYFDEIYAKVHTSYDKTEKSVTKCIIAALHNTIDALAENKEAFIKIFQYLSNPIRLNLELKAVYTQINAIWYDFGKDTSLDFNFYSKRLLLHAVYESMLRYFIVDNSNDHEDTKDFVVRKIGNILSLGKTIRNIQDKVQKWL